MQRKTVIRLTNNIVIFILTGVIYVFMEVFATSVMAPSMIEKYQFNPLDKALYEKMAFKPPYKEITGEEVSLQPIQRLSLIGASSIWMFFVGGLSGFFLYLLYNAAKNKFNLFFLCLTGTLIITVLELGSGVLLNGILKLYIWDYTTHFLNLWGQICLAHTLLYFFAICPFGYWFFHFLEAQYPENNTKTYSLRTHYASLFKPQAKKLTTLYPR